MILEKGDSIKIDATRCLNQRYQGAQCRHCLSGCPARAILLDEGNVELKSDLCLGCGLCLSDCPTQVFRSEGWDEASVISRVKNRGWKITEFFCAKHSAPYQKDRTPDRGALQLPGCLTLASRGCWYELGLQTAVELRLDQCLECPMAQTLPRLDVNIGTASEWLTASGHRPEFAFIGSGNGEKTPKSLKAVETGEKVTSRRDLILSVLGRGGRTAGLVSERKASAFTAIREQKTDDCLPDWRKRLAKLYPKNRADKASAAWWPTIQINNRCVHCGLCALFCPTGALQSAVSDNTCNYTFNAGLCLDCRICGMVCGHEAITRDKKKVLNPFDSATIYRAEVFECRRCGSVTSDQNTGLCYWCGKEAATDLAFKKACHALFFDGRFPGDGR